MQRWEELYYAKHDGKIEGKIEGKMNILIRQVCKKLAKNKTPEEIAEELEEKPDRIIPICETAEEFAPEYDCQKVFESFHAHFPGIFSVEEKNELFN